MGGARHVLRSEVEADMCGEAIHIIQGRRITLVDYRSHIERGKI
jgi:hypothetical protein